MLAVHFGAGNIGRGFIGSLLSQSSYEVVFVDVNEEVVHLLNERKEYRVLIADESGKEEIIRNVSAVNSQTENDKVIHYLTEADLVTTAVGPNILPIISSTLAEGLRKRLSVNQKPLNIIACENMIGGTTFLKEKVFEKISDEEKSLFERNYGFLDCAVDRIVPNQKNSDPLAVTVEPFFEWVVEQKDVVGDMPNVRGMQLVDDLLPYIERKLFTVNTGHAMAAYLGYNKKLQTIKEAMDDKEIYFDVQQALNESGAVLVKRYGFNENEHKKYIEKIIHRFTNPSISDEIVRVARSPIRKVGANDRLMKPAKQYYELFNEVPAGLTKGIAALLLFDYQEDPEAIELQETIMKAGIEGALSQYAQLEKDHPLADAIIKYVEGLRETK
ncbi:MAG: mannitol-1-phosphate 5-dehydrogenase [Bacillus sp. (in: Bacteria)]|nr:mannitol-1-phosphate 5-dehydrogenase [Bacillus sp. (in: firmicutes)]